MKKITKTTKVVTPEEKLVNELKSMSNNVFSTILKLVDLFYVKMKMLVVMKNILKYLMVNKDYQH